MTEGLPANRKYVIVALVVVLGVVAFGYSKGWFSPSSPNVESATNDVSATQTLDQGQATADVAQATSTATEPTSPAAE